MYSYTASILTIIAGLIAIIGYIIASRCFYGTSDPVFLLLQIAIMLLLSIIAYRIFRYTDSIGRRVGIILLLLLLVAIPYVMATTCMSSLALVLLLPTLIIMLMIMVAMVHKDMIVSLLLVPVIVWFLIFGSYLIRMISE